MYWHIFLIWQVSLLLSQIRPELVGEKIEAEHLYDAVNVILSLQVLIEFIIVLKYFLANVAF